MTLKERIKNEMMVIKALGVVYGDIGTSPIYTLAVIFLIVPPTVVSIYGILSFVFWALTILVTIQYAWLATSLSAKGEGGTVVLIQMLTPHLKSAKMVSIVSVLGFLGLSLMIGDGVITPAISILSAVEGILLIPQYEELPQIVLLVLATLIAFALFAVQKRGVEKVASTFGPIMVIWFLCLGGVGFWYVSQDFSILNAINPMYAINFALANPVITFIILADIILATTGGEALYADMGHLGRLPILKGWVFAFIALILSYYGQGAFLLTHPESVGSPLFEMMREFAPLLYVPFLILTIIATIIASQAMISGIFSVLYQAMTTRIFPHFRVEYTSHELRSQIYVGSINWFLFVCVIIMLFVFKESAKLAAAYGLAVAGAMSITGVLMTMIFAYRREWIKMSFATFSGIVSFVFFLSCLLKIPHGGFWSLLIAAVPLGFIILYTQGQERLYSSFHSVDKENFLQAYNAHYAQESHIEGTALFFARKAENIPAYIPKTMFQNGIIYERNVIVKVKPTNEPLGITNEFKSLAEGLDLLVIHVGYMEVFNMEESLKKQDIHERTIFYGDEEIVSKHFSWKLYALIKDMSPSFVSFYNFPQEKLIGVSRRIEI
ncbi:potassium transporter Kup [Sulfurospirillum diekertiae]|jgi:KUP system potassium uptake protein|uniref:Potassium transporter Kup n=1 Tax=Sulfurospirillum diekertiae TaxID=1854492 RepID=A0A290HU51_9BACT|nr:KUP/HAK/KT family potassium transporter [Sulfurospirillum diekertiae]ATB68899.1 potassium transporter Kup [Sulfurospirillum diekertiae]